MCFVPTFTHGANSAGMRRNNEIETFLSRHSGTYYGLRSHEPCDIPHVKTQLKNLRRKITLPESKLYYYPLQIEKGFEPRKPPKFKPFKETRVENNRIVTLSCREIGHTDHALFGLTKEEIVDVITSIVGDGFVSKHDVEFEMDVGLWKSLNSTSYVRQDNPKTRIGTKIKIKLYFEDEETAVWATVKLHDVRLNFKWRVEGPKIRKEKTYSQYTFESMVVHWFTRLNSDYVSTLPAGEYTMLLKNHSDGIMHNPTMTVNSFSLEDPIGRPMFEDNSPITKPLPKFIAVGSESKTFHLVKDSMKDVIPFQEIAIVVKENDAITFRICFDPMFCTCDRMNAHAYTGCTPITQSAGLAYDNSKRSEMDDTLCKTIPCFHSNYFKARHVLFVTKIENFSDETKEEKEEKKEFNRRYRWPNPPATDSIPGVSMVFYPGGLHGALHTCLLVMNLVMRKIDNKHPKYKQFRKSLDSCGEFITKGDICICASIIFEMFHQTHVVMGELFEQQKAGEMTQYKELFHLISVQLIVTRRFRVKKMAQRVGLIFQSAAIWVFIGQLSRLAKWEGPKEDRAHLIHEHGGPCRDWLAYYPVFGMEFSILGGFNEEREEGSATFQAAMVTRKLKRTKAPTDELMGRIDLQALLIPICKSISWKNKRFIEDTRYAMQNLRFSSSFFWQWGRAVVGIVSAWRIANFILKEKFDLNIDDFVTYFEDGSIQINCGFDKDSHILLSQNNVFTISKECDQETWMKRMKGISDFHTEIHQKNGGVGDYWDDITEAKYCVDLYVLFVFNEQ